MLIEKLKDLKIVDLITVVVPGIIVIGFSYKFGFYYSKAIDANWVLSLFTPIDFITAQFNLYIYYFTAVVYLDRVIGGSEKLKEGLITGNATMLGSFIGLYFLQGKIAFIFYVYALVSLHAIALILYSKSIGLRSLGFLAIFVILPMIAGGQEATKVSQGILPVVKLSKTIDVVGPWYLLDKFSDKAILINPTQTMNYFKVVELKEIEYIQSAKLDKK
ncbi:MULTISPECIES: hypothetical protein [Acinetobacter calcoaceticus/baumannii complex]|uniref:hypothetical protein n=1 Tax=Acinetobacter calcoaceticus/baumannii complex TaxID=909768 RepID=UPI0007074DE2|nr:MULTISPECIES: hypothetical protein [Acinetobacter calcoaceticus/baumannii complex]KQE86336.1 hypothetical protein APB94_16385 [Acinetobacter lactucae]